MNASFAYDNEYLGPAVRLAATPLTDRCHLSLTMAMHSSQCGTMIGPAQTGKSETVKEFAKVCCAVLNLLRGHCTSYPKISILVLYLKIINTFLINNTCIV